MQSIFFANCWSFHSSKLCYKTLLKSLNLCVCPSACLLVLHNHFLRNGCSNWYKIWQKLRIVNLLACSGKHLSMLRLRGKGSPHVHKGCKAVHFFSPTFMWNGRWITIVLSKAGLIFDIRCKRRGKSGDWKVIITFTDPYKKVNRKIWKILRSCHCIVPRGQSSHRGLEVC